MTVASRLRSAGLRSHTRLVFRVRAGRTRLVVADAGAPLKALRSFELEDGRALLQLISAAPGLFGGDRYRLEIAAEAGARAVVLTPTAIKIHSMPAESFAEQQVDLQVAEGASLEYYPALNIPFPQADLAQRATAAVSAGGRLAVVESWSMGRVLRGERLAFRRLSAALKADREGRPIYRDRLELTPDARLPEWGLLEGANYMVSGFWCGFGLEPPEAESGLEVKAATIPVDDDAFAFRGLFRDSVEASQRVRRLQSWAVGGLSRRFW